MSLIKELERAKTDLEELGVEKIRAEGKLEQAMDDLKKAGFDSLDKAKKEFVRLTDLKAKAEKEAQEFLGAFKVKYADFIE